MFYVCVCVGFSFCYSPFDSFFGVIDVAIFIVVAVAVVDDNDGMVMAFSVCVFIFHFVASRMAKTVKGKSLFLF